MRTHPLGIYEKALPRNTSWVEKLALAKSCGFDFVEMSVDESEERRARLDWPLAERMEIINAIQKTGVRIPTMCLSAHRRFPFGSHDSDTRQQARIIMQKALRLAQDLGVRTIQLAGYDVYYEPQMMKPSLGLKMRWLGLRSKLQPRRLCALWKLWIRPLLTPSVNGKY